LSFAELETLEKNDPSLIQELFLKRSLDYRDPARVPNSYSGLNKMPLSSVKKVIRPDILEKDRKTVEYILGRIQQDEETEEYYQQMKTQNALITRQRFLKRHERNIALEEKAGIRKPLSFLSEPILTQNEKLN
jgi:hypothetical protein